TRRSSDLFFAPILLSRMRTAIACTSLTLEKASQEPAAPLAAAHQVPHHGPGLFELLQQPVDVLHARAAASRDPAPPAAVDDRRVPPLFGGHRLDDGFDPAQLPL